MLFVNKIYLSLFNFKYEVIFAYKNPLTCASDFYKFGIGMVLFGSDVAH